MTDYKLTYFDMDGGRAEPVRIAFHAAGIDFDDIRISFSDFAEMRKNFRYSRLTARQLPRAMRCVDSSGRRQDFIQRTTCRQCIAMKPSV